MQISDLFRGLGEETFGKIIRGISIGKLKTYQIYEGFKVRAHLHKVNTEALRKSTPKFWARIVRRHGIGPRRNCRTLSGSCDALLLRAGSSMFGKTGASNWHGSSGGRSEFLDHPNVAVLIAAQERETPAVP